MKKSDIDALVHAHRGRVRPVAFLHVLRQTSLGPDDHTFLSDNVADLGASDLLRWRARCEKGFTSPIVRQLARRAIADPASFRHEVLSVPRLELDSDDWTELADLTRGKVPREVFDLVCERGHRAPRPYVEPWFTPGVLPAPLLGPADDDVLPEDLANPEALASLPIRKLVAAFGRGLLDDEGAGLEAMVTQRARTETDDWSLAALGFPASLTGAVLEKAKNTASGDERANLLGWLEAHDVSRAVLFPIALTPIGDGGPSFALVAWLAGQLVTRAAWDKHGRGALACFMEQAAFAQIADLFTIAWSEAGRDRDTPPRGLLESMQVAFALTLIDVAKSAHAKGDDPRALGALSALVCLDPPSRVSRAVHELASCAASSPEVMALVRLNERLVKHSDAREASFEGLIAGVHALADTVGPTLAERS